MLVGTISIEKSEYLSGLLKKRGIPHNVLNAKQHEREAEIVAQAGKLGAVTIATNMAGRGTDIMLGGNAEYMARSDLKKAGFDDDVIAEATGYADTDNEEVLKAREMFAERMKAHKAVTDEEAEKVRATGGLFILGTERHESRRIDNQLRCAAAPDARATRARAASLPGHDGRHHAPLRQRARHEHDGRAEIDDDTPLDQKMLTNAIEQAQKTVESRNFQTRKNVLEYDDVMKRAAQRHLRRAQKGARR